MLTKEKLRNTIDAMPDKSTLDEVIDKIILLVKVEQGLNDINAGNLYTTEEVKGKLNKWLK